MKLRAVIVLPAVITAGAIAALGLMLLTPQRALPSALLQQPTPTPTREPLSGEKISINFLIRIPYGIISEENESYIRSYIRESIPAGNPSNTRYYTKHYNKDVILISQEILLPMDNMYVDENSYYGVVFRHYMEWPPGYPLGFPPEMTITDINAVQREIYRGGFKGPGYYGRGDGYPLGVTEHEKFLFDIFAFGYYYYIIYKNERVLIARYHGYFLVGEEQVDLFWFLFEQLGENKALIIDAEAYDEWWTDSREREFWINRFTPPPPSVTPATPSTLPPLPPGTPALSTKQR